MKNKSEKNTTIKTIYGSLQLVIHFLFVIPLYWAFGQKQKHQYDLNSAELSYWAKTTFGKSHQQFHDELAQEDPVAAATYASAVIAEKQ